MWVMTMADISVHDNIVTGYSVLCEDREVIIHTEFRERDPVERTDVTFMGVEAYYIFRDNMSSILFDVSEVAPVDILREFSQEFEVGKRYGWPGFWNKSNQDCLDHFAAHKCKCWLITSSLGMEGFVIAREMKFEKV
jgi:hypothetical protein